jgi:hypothetical protein
VGSASRSGSRLWALHSDFYHFTFPFLEKSRESRIQRNLQGVEICRMRNFPSCLTGLYPSIAQRLIRDPLLNSPALVSDIFRELQLAFQERCCMELMD